MSKIIDVAGIEFDWSCVGSFDQDIDKSSFQLYDEAVTNIYNLWQQRIKESK